MVLRKSVISNLPATSDPHAYISQNFEDFKNPITSSLTIHTYVDVLGADNTLYKFWHECRILKRKRRAWQMSRCFKWIRYWLLFCKPKRMPRIVPRILNRSAHDMSYTCHFLVCYGTSIICKTKEGSKLCQIQRRADTFGIAADRSWWCVTSPTA